MGFWSSVGSFVSGAENVEYDTDNANKTTNFDKYNDEYKEAQIFINKQFTKINKKISDGEFKELAIKLEKLKKEKKWDFGVV